VRALSDHQTIATECRLHINALRMARPFWTIAPGRSFVISIGSHHQKI
jgi:hypothetical protein